MKWLICGGRDFDDQEMFDQVMRSMIADLGMPDVIVHGDARGADRMADAWADRFFIPRRPYAAKWEEHRRAAGPIRNQEMIDMEHPDLCLAFPGGSGTADMIGKAFKAGIRVVLATE